MKLLRWAAASLLGLVGVLLAVLGGLLTGTLVLAPIGIPLLLLARQVFRVSGRLVVPRAVRHPLDELDRAGTDAAARAAGAAGKTVKKGTRNAGTKVRRLRRGRRSRLERLTDSLPGS